MGLDSGKKKEVQSVIEESIRQKLEKYKLETKQMPFHYRLLGKDRMALYSFIQSLNTTFGVSIYEPVAIAIASSRFKQAKSQVRPYHLISQQAQREIQNIIDQLSAGIGDVNKQANLKTIRAVSQLGEFQNVKLTKADIWLQAYDDSVYLIDLKTVKPNKGNFREFKRTLLEWAGAEMAQNSRIKINTLIGIPYNPYFPKPYERWTMKGMLDLQEELLVGKELWDFLGGDGAYEGLLDCFEHAGINMRSELDSYFSKFIDLE